MRVIMPAIIDQVGRNSNGDEADGVSGRHNGVDVSSDPSELSTGSSAVSGGLGPEPSVWRSGPARARVRLPCPQGRPGSRAPVAPRVP
jgi:hypothetical protein